MTTADRSTWNALYDGLRTQYLQTLPIRLEELESALEEVRTGARRHDLRERLTLHAHKMVGSDKTFGFDEISRHARRLEDALLDNGNSIEEAVRHAAGLIAECRKAVGLPYLR
ncbi:Hpt domain-containing protein [Breoghania sp.]|uniref:Hpt domain-containing protein n=1 Tax=Breoghania sp. TaxID=2065378 RepID=UPI0026188893|nr:Hpt domain-containing protein [Breoghania sp.]MDJ0932813.1 Hpt domain-containing protein [Breoghania sp.]